MNGRPVVSIVVVTYGTGPIVLEALDAVARHTPIDHEVIVVDCLPVDPDTRTSTLLADRADIRLFAVDDNLGFAGGNEYGVEQATGEYLCFLNPDLVVGPGWLEPLLGALDDPAVGIAAPVFLNPDGSLQEAGQLVFSDTFTAPVGGFDVLAGDRSNIFSRDVDYASAACWVVRRTDHDAIGGFDRHYHPAYFEDADYALRMEAAGKRTRLVADVPVLHHHGLGSGTRDAAVGQVTHARFKRRWAAELADRPARPTTDAEAIAARDRLVDATTLFIVWSDHASESEAAAAFEDAVTLASASPRERVTLLTDTAPSMSDDERARAGGLEVVVAGPEHRDELAAARSGLADEVVSIGTAPTGRRRVSTPTLVAAAVVFVAGVVIRWILFDSPAAVINADEAYSRIETYEILRGQFPMVLGGTVYTLPVEAYLYTPFTYLFSGANVVPLKLLSTNPIRLDMRRESFTIRVSAVPEASTVRVVDPRPLEVRVEIDTTPVDRKFENLPVELVGQVYLTRMSPATLTLTLSGPPALVDGIVPDQIRLVADVAGLEPQAADRQVPVVVDFIDVPIEDRARVSVTSLSRNTVTVRVSDERLTE